MFTLYYICLLVVLVFIAFWCVVSLLPTKYKKLAVKYMWNGVESNE